MDYILIINGKETSLVEGKDRKEIAKIELSELEKEVFLPVKFKILAKDGEEGEILTWLPKTNWIRARFSAEVSDLTVENGKTFVREKDLAGKKTSFEIRLFDSMPEDFEKAAKAEGLIKSYLAKRNQAVAEVHLFAKHNEKRVLLKLLDGADWKPFLPILLLDELQERLKDKKVKEEISIPLPPDSKKRYIEPLVFKEDKEEKKKSEKVEKRHSKSGEGFKSFAEFSLSFPIIKRKEAIKYIDQAGEWSLFCELADKKTSVILNGPTGNGKSTMVRYYAFTRDLPFFRKTGHRDITMRDLEGFWVPTANDPMKTPGPLILAMVHGGIFFFEEIGPVSQEVLNGIHNVLDEGEIEIHSHFGFERIKAHPDFRIICSGNLDRNYTMNELGESFLERFSQIKLGYPDREGTINIITSVTRVNKQLAEVLTDLVFETRNVLGKYQKDLGLRGAVRIAQDIYSGTEQSFVRLVEAHLINPKTTYEETSLREELQRAVEKVLKINSQDWDDAREDLDAEFADIASKN